MKALQVKVINKRETIKSKLEKRKFIKFFLESKKNDIITTDDKKYNKEWLMKRDLYFLQQAFPQIYKKFKGEN